MTSAYTAENLKLLAADLQANGLTEPITLIELNPPQQVTMPDGTTRTYTAKVLRGHRRSEAIKLIRLAHPDLFEKVKADVYPPDTDRKTQALIICDHGSVTKLNEFEKYLTVKRLRLEGFKQEEIMTRMGEKRGWVQERWMLAGLPSQFELAYQAKFDPLIKANNPNLPEIRMKDIRDINTLILAAGGIHTPEGKAEASAAWDKLIQNSGNPAALINKPKLRTMDEVNDALAMCQNDPKATLMLRWFKNDASVTLADFVTQ